MKYLIMLLLAASGIAGYAASGHKLLSPSMNRYPFKDFVQEFPEHKLPYSIETPSAAYNEINDIFYGAGGYIPELKISSFSRRTKSNASPNACLKKDGAYTLLVYSVEEKVNDTLIPVRTIMASYNAKGNRIDQIDFACQCAPDMYKTGTIDTAYRITVTSYKSTWKNDPAQDGYDDNEIIKTEKTAVAKYYIDDKGRFHTVGENKM